MSQLYLTTPSLSLLDQEAVSQLSTSRREVLTEIQAGDLDNVLDAAEAEANKILQPDSSGNHPRISNLTKAAREVLDLCKRYREEPNQFSLRFDAIIPSLLKRSPLAAAALVCGFDLFNLAEESQFGSLPEFARAYAVALLEQYERDSLYRDSYEWIGQNVHNTVFTSIHGDMLYSQVKIGVPVRKIDLLPDDSYLDFKSTIDPSAINPKSTESVQSGVLLYQDGSPMLCALLDFARREGLSKIREIAQWKSVLEEVGEFHTNTAEAFGSNEEFMERMISESILLSQDYRVESDEGRQCSFISWSVRGYGTSDGEDRAFYYPFYQRGELLFLKADSQGDFRMSGDLGNLSESRYRVMLRFEKEDISQALRGTLKLFARDRHLMGRLMERFNERHQTEE